MGSVKASAGVVLLVAVSTLTVTSCGAGSSSPVGAGGGSSTATGSGTGAATSCTPGEERVCVCYGIPNGTQVCNEAGTGFSACPSCSSGGGGAAGGSGGGSAACAGHCQNGLLDCGETDVDCGGTCTPCATHVYVEADCIKSARNGSEICDDAAWTVAAPGTGLVLVCLTDAGGVIYVATNTGPPDPDDGIRRCQGWEKTGQDAWDHLDYLYQLTCQQEQQQIDLDLSAYVGQTLYFGAHNQPSGGGQFTHMCVAWKQ